jgi:hypothetical protein
MEIGNGLLQRAVTLSRTSEYLIHGCSSLNLIGIAGIYIAGYLSSGAFHQQLSMDGIKSTLFVTTQHRSLITHGKAR